MKLQYFSFAIPVLVLASGTTHGGSIAPSDFSGNETLINYDSLAEQEVITDQFASAGALFETANGFTVAASAIGDLFDLGSAPNAAFVTVETGGFLRIIFDAPQLRFGTQFESSLNESIILDAFGENGMLETVATQGELNSSGVLEGFIGVENDLGITHVEIRSSTSGFNFGIEDTRFEAIPEPTTTAVLGSCVIVAAFRRNRLMITKR